MTANPDRSASCSPCWKRRHPTLPPAFVPAWDSQNPANRRRAEECVAQRVLGLGEIVDQRQRVHLRIVFTFGVHCYAGRKQQDRGRAILHRPVPRQSVDQPERMLQGLAQLGQLLRQHWRGRCEQQRPAANRGGANRGE